MMRKLIGLGAIISILLIGSGMAFAADPASPAPGTPASPAPGSVLTLKIDNPLKVNTIQDAVKFFINTIVKLAIPVIVFFFLYSGFMLILAQGKPEAIAKARRMFFYTLIGTLLILGAWSITNAIVGTVNSLAK